MIVPSITDVKRILKELTEKRFERMEIELIYLRKGLRKMQEELTVRRRA